MEVVLKWHMEPLCRSNLQLVRGVKPENNFNKYDGIFQIMKQTY